MSDHAAAAVKPEQGGAADAPPVKQFNVFLQEHRGAGLHNELSEGLAELTAAVLRQQKKGSLTVTVNVAPAEGAAVAVVVTDEVKVKAPKAATPPSLFFSDDHGNLSRRDPRQTEMPLREAGKS